MKQNLFSVITISIALFACIIPTGIAQPEMLPTFDANILSTGIAQTAQAASTQTQAAITPTVFSTATQTLIPATETLIPPTLGLPNQGTYLAKQDNGTTRFFDQTAMYELIIPVGWIAIRVNGPEYFETLALAASASVEFQTALKNTQSQNSDVFRLFVFNLKEGSSTGPYTMNLNVVWDQQDSSSLEEALKKIESQYPKIFPGIQMVNLGIIPTAKNIPSGLIESTWVTKSAAGEELFIFQKQAVVKLRTGTLAITLSVPTGLKDIASPAFDMIISELIVK